MSQAEGCEIGQFTLKNVAWGSSSPNATNPDRVFVSAEDILITPLLLAGGVGLAFSSMPDLDVLNVSGQQTITAFLDYTIDPPPPILDDFFLDILGNTPTGNGLARATARVCAGDFLVDGCANGFEDLLIATLTADTSESAVFVFPQPVNIVDVRLMLELLANGDTSQIAGVRQTVATVPDPSPALLMWGGALALALNLRKRR